jgi:signal transduction histidine kinase
MPAAALPGPGRPPAFRLRVGLRGRVTAALILASGLTLAVMALALLTPLQRRLRDDAVNGLTETTLAARPVLAGLPARAVRPGAGRLQLTVDEIHRRTGADVAAVDAQGRILAASEPMSGARFADVVAAVAGDRVVAGVGGSREGSEAQVAVPVGRAYGLSLRRPLSGLESAGDVVRRGFLLGAAAAMAAALLMDGFVARRLVRRLNSLRDAVTAAGDAGAGDPPFDDAGHDEVGDLTRAFAAMQGRVRVQEQARRRFVATASHELRTPLASLRLMLGMLEEDLDAAAPDLADARHQVARATAQAERLSRLAGDLLDLSRLDAAVALRDEPVDLRALARAVGAEFEDVRGVAVVLEPEERRAGWALGDPGAVAQILRILLDNALRVAPAGTAVTVALRREGTRCLAGIRDEGPGVAPGDRERIFRRFERGGAAWGGREVSSGGFGLGLAIGRELARRMGGDIRLSSPASPTCFTLELPIAAGERRVPQPAPLPSARGVRVA